MVFEQTAKDARRLPAKRDMRSVTITVAKKLKQRNPRQNAKTRNQGATCQNVRRLKLPRQSRKHRGRCFVVNKAAALLRGVAGFKCPQATLAIPGRRKFAIEAAMDGELIPDSSH